MLGRSELSQPGPLSCLRGVDDQCSTKLSPDWTPRGGGSEIGPQTRQKVHQMRVQIAQAEINVESVTDVQAAAKKMFAASMQPSPKDPLRVVSAAPRRDVRRACAGRRRCGKSTPRSSRVPGAPGSRRGLAHRAAQRSAAEGHRLAPVVLRATAESPCADRRRPEARRRTLTGR
jgi:hypothetical protein